MLHKFSPLPANRDLPWRAEDVLPRALVAGESAGQLTTAGAALLGDLLPAGIPLAPPEGDAGTGMAAANAVAPASGNVSAGTSIFSMVVLDKPLSGVYPEIDMVTYTGKFHACPALFCNSNAGNWHGYSAKENVRISRLTGHGGLFKTPVVGQRFLAAAVNSPVWLMKTAEEGGPYVRRTKKGSLRRESGASEVRFGYLYMGKRFRDRSGSRHDGYKAERCFL